MLDITWIILNIFRTNKGVFTIKNIFAKSNGEKIPFDENSENRIDLEDDVIIKKELKTISYNEVNDINSLKI